MGLLTVSGQFVYGERGRLKVRIYSEMKDLDKLYDFVITIFYQLPTWSEIKDRF